MSTTGRTAALILIGVLGMAAADARGAQPPDDRAKLRFEPLPLGSIKPAGWLKDQLRIQAEGLGGHLDEFWPDIKESAWFGGKAEGWERVPYWLDGLVPLAYLLDDPALKAKVKKSVDYILDHQHPDGWLGPVGDAQKHRPYDVWPLFPLFKALTQYQEATGDPRVIPALLKCCRKIDAVISKEPMYSWAKFRAADLAVTLSWLHDRTHEAWLLDLAKKAFAQGHDWRAEFEHFPYTEKSIRHHELDNHGVNIGMALKYGGERYRLTGDEKDREAVFRMLEQLDRYHGQPTGMFTCDEHLAGRSPSQGTELCTVVEAMYSLEELAGALGDARLGDRLERIAFNALPATFKKDMTAHQYDQQCNQVICSTRGEHVYTSNGPTSNLYGLEPNFGCCTANFHQGWPKFASHLWMKTSDGGLAVIAYAPCVVETTIQGKAVKVEVDTAYPFQDDIRIRVTKPGPGTFPLHIRLPEWAERVVVRSRDAEVGSDDSTSVDRVDYGPTPGRIGSKYNGGIYVEHARRWSGTKTTIVEIKTPTRLYEGVNDSVAIVRGPLVFALPIEAEWKKVKDNPQFADWEVYPKSPWNYALRIDRKHPENSIQFGPVGRSPFSQTSAPIQARVKGRRLKSWALERGAAAPPPRSPVASDEPLEDLTLVPYGCTDLRITEFPVLGNW